MKSPAQDAPLPPAVAEQIARLSATMAKYMRPGDRLVASRAYDEWEVRVVDVGGVLRCVLCRCPLVVRPFVDVEMTAPSGPVTSLRVMPAILRILCNECIDEAREQGAFVPKTGA